MNAEWPMTDSVVPHWAGRQRRAHVKWEKEDRKELTDLWYRKPALSIDRIAEIMGREPGALYTKARQMGLPGRRELGGAKRGKRRKLPKHGGTGRRFKGVENSAGPKISLEPHDPRLRGGITVFPSTVIPASRLTRLLKSGHNSRKIGAKMAKGKWKGQPVYTLTLEERATCPRSCKEFATCYGNNMPFAQRIYDDGTLTKRLWGELASIAAENPAGFVVRLHVLGDFSSVDYVEFWREALNDFPALNIFGFTARIPPDPIGVALVRLTADFYDRFRMRFSGADKETDCSEVVERPEDVRWTRCPAETDPDRSCASCGLCMQSNINISFVRH